LRRAKQLNFRVRYRFKLVRRIVEPLRVSQSVKINKIDFSCLAEGGAYRE
jgi:hypothetical protein